jgi:hypothetical protein
MLAEFTAKLASAAAEEWGWRYPWVIQTQLSTTVLCVELKVIDRGMGEVPGFMWTDEFIVQAEISHDEMIKRGIDSIKERMNVTD